MQKKIFDELRLTGDLPSPSSIGLRILELTQRDDYSQEDLTRTIMADPALSSRVIKLANSVITGTLQPVDSVPQAAMRLGARTVGTIALGFTLVSDNRQGQAEHFDYDRYWARSLATAVASNTIARARHIYESADAFTCGLLCEVGRLALASVHPHKYSEILEDNPHIDDRELAGLETRAFEIDHMEVTAALLADWGLPVAFSEAVLSFRREEQPEEMTENGRALSTLLLAGRTIGRLLCSPQSDTSPEWTREFFRLEQAADRLGMSVGDLHRLCDEVMPEWHDWGQLIDVTTARPFSFVEAAAYFTERGISAPAAPQVAPDATASGSGSTLEPADGGADPHAPLNAGRLIARGRAVPEEERQTRILLIDDDQRMLRLLSHHLSREGNEVITAKSSHEGLEKSLQLLPQIVITDWMMPGMTGIQLCETLRKSETGRKMYVVIVTAREDDEQVVEAFASGADDYIVKPFNPQVLLARVRAGQRMIRMREQVESSERERLKQVAELGILTRKLRAAAMTDALTGLPNRRYVMKRLKQEWDSVERSGRPLSVIIGDIDFFKRVNDLYGHDVGDSTLREIAQSLREHSRTGDILCRLGGEEFLSINMGCDGPMAVKCAERLRLAIEVLPGQGGDQDRGVTMSFGVAERSPNMAKLDDLIKCADQALYEAKDAGRNCVVLRTWPGRQSASA